MHLQCTIQPLQPAGARKAPEKRLERGSKRAARTALPKPTPEPNPGWLVKSCVELPSDRPLPIRRPGFGDLFSIPAPPPPPPPPPPPAAVPVVVVPGSAPPPGSAMVSCLLALGVVGLGRRAGLAAAPPVAPPEPPVRSRCRVEAAGRFEVAVGPGETRREAPLPMGGGRESRRNAPQLSGRCLPSSKVSHHVIHCEDVFGNSSNVPRILPGGLRGTRCWHHCIRNRRSGVIGATRGLSASMSLSVWANDHRS